MHVNRKHVLCNINTISVSHSTACATLTYFSSRWFIFEELGVLAVVRRIKTCVDEDIAQGYGFQRCRTLVGESQSYK